MCTIQKRALIVGSIVLGIFLVIVCTAALSPSTALKYEGVFFLGPFLLGAVFAIALLFVVNPDKSFLRFPKGVRVLLTFGFIALLGTILFWGVFVVSRFTQPLASRCAAQIAALETSLNTVIVRLRSLQHQSPPSTSPLKKPFLLVRSELLSNNTPHYASIQFATKWYRESLGDIGNRLDYEVLSISPNFDPVTAVIVATSYRDTGNRIALDIGSVPEFRDFGMIFVVDLQSGMTLWNSGLLVGSPATKPFGGPGTNYYSKLQGEAIPWRQLKDTVDSLQWSAASTR